MWYIVKWPSSLESQNHVPHRTSYILSCLDQFMSRRCTLTASGVCTYASTESTMPDRKKPCTSARSDTIGVKLTVCTTQRTYEKRPTSHVTVVPHEGIRHAQNILLGFVRGFNIDQSGNSHLSSFGVCCGLLDVGEGAGAPDGCGPGFGFGFGCFWASVVAVLGFVSVVWWTCLPWCLLRLLPLVPFLGPAALAFGLFGLLPCCFLRLFGVLCCVRRGACRY